MLKLIILAVAVIILQNADAGNQKLLLCYYGTWATYRQGLGKFDVSNIDPNICTHVIYTFAGLNEDGTVKVLDPWLDLPDNWGRDNFGKFVSLKEQNRELKTILAIGGWNEGSAKYSRMADDPTLRSVFVESATQIILKHGFDGLDLDWEYPNRRDTIYGPADIVNFVQLLSELRESFDNHGLLLTAAVASVEEMAQLSYDIPAICKSLDLISLMTYDMHGAWDQYTGHNSPLHKGEGDENVPREKAFTVDVAVEYWLSKGCPPEKLLVGVPLYGRTFTLAQASDSGVRAPVTGAGVAGPYTAQNGVIGYNELCNMLKTEAWDLRYDSLAKVPYAVKDRDWITYDDTESIVAKVNYAFEKGLVGIMAWSIETDDFHGTCHGETFPLLKSINKALKASNEAEPATTASPILEPTTPTVTEATCTTASDGNSSVCQKEGFAQDPTDCSIFYICTSDERGNLYPYKFICPSMLLWDQKNHLCNYPELVDCLA